MRALSGADVIQALQEFWMDAGQLSSKLYIEFDNQMTQGAAQKWLLANESNIMAAP